ncbi:hypothetical protein F5Y17DRAFT_339963 [Xylariaceae sp. FL0594]|nr:hypothetical protein F5Y17DRAFT_339963 [Xylariaceae sp. FL0594]
MLYCCIHCRGLCGCWTLQEARGNTLYRMLRCCCTASSTCILCSCQLLALDRPLTARQRDQPDNSGRSLIGSRTCHSGVCHGPYRFCRCRGMSQTGKYSLAYVNSYGYLYSQVLLYCYCLPHNHSIPSCGGSSDSTRGRARAESPSTPPQTVVTGPAEEPVYRPMGMNRKGFIYNSDKTTSQGCLTPTKQGDRIHAPNELA